MGAWLVAVRAAGSAPRCPHGATGGHPGAGRPATHDGADVGQLVHAVRQLRPARLVHQRGVAAYLAFPLVVLLLRPLRRLHPLLTMVLAHVAIAPLVVIAFRTGPLDAEQSW